MKLCGWRMLTALIAVVVPFSFTTVLVIGRNDSEHLRIYIQASISRFEVTPVANRESESTSRDVLELFFFAKPESVTTSSDGTTSCESLH